MLRQTVNSIRSLKMFSNCIVNIPIHEIVNWGHSAFFGKHSLLIQPANVIYASALPASFCTPAKLATILTVTSPIAIASISQVIIIFDRIAANKIKLNCCKSIALL